MLEEVNRIPRLRAILDESVMGFPFQRQIAEAIAFAPLL